MAERIQQPDHDLQRNNLHGTYFKALGHAIPEPEQRGIRQPPDLQQGYGKGRPDQHGKSESKPDQAGYILVSLDPDAFTNGLLPAITPFIQTIQQIGPQSKQEDGEHP